MSTLDFFKAMFGGEDKLETGFLLITNLQGANYFTRDLRKAAQKAHELAEESDVYFGTGLYEKKTSRGHGTEGDIVGRGFYCLDIDIKGPGHKNNNLPETEEEALAIVRAQFNYEPTALVRSGGGIHVYFAFKEPVFFEEAEERAECKKRNLMLHRIVKRGFDEKEYALDNVSNLNRMLRVPGTWNHKTGHKRRVEMVSLDADKQINDDVVDELYDEEAYEKRESIAVEGDNPFNLIIDPRIDPPMTMFLALYETNAVFKSAWECVGSKENKASISGFQMTLANIAKNNDWSDQHICDLLIAHRREKGANSDPRKLTRLDYYTRTIQKAYDRLKKDATVDQVIAVSKSLQNAETEEEKQNSRTLLMQYLRSMLGVDLTDIRAYHGLREVTYEMCVNGIPCDIGGVQKLFSLAHVTQRIAALSKNVIKDIKKKDWLVVVEAILKCAEDVSIGEGMDETDMLRDKITMFLQSRKARQEKDEAALNANPFIENDETYIFISGFRDWMSMRNDKMDTRTFAVAMAKLGHKSVKMNFMIDGKRTSRHVYKLKL